MSSYYAQARPRRKKSKKRIVVVSALSLMCLIGVGMLIVTKTMNGSSKGSASNVVLTAPSLLPSFDSKPVTFNSPYVSFMYPKSLQPGGGGSVGGPDLASYVYVFHDTESWKLAIGIERLQSASLLNDSAYVYRTEHPDDYKQSAISVNGKAYTVMTDLTMGGFDELAFSLSGSKVAEISLYGADESGNENLQTTFDMVLGSWVWH